MLATLTMQSTWYAPKQLNLKSRVQRRLHRDIDSLLLTPSYTNILLKVPKNKHMLSK